MSIDFDSIITQEPFPDFWAAWQSSRVEGNIPLRADIRLQNFARFADSLQIYELKSPRDLRCRLIGSKVAERVQQVSPEDNLFDFFSEPAAAIGEKWWVNMASTPCGGLMCFSTHYANGIKRMVPSLVLPITGAKGQKLFLALNSLPRMLDRSEPSGKLIIAEDAFEGKFLDVGYGLPIDVPNPICL